MPALLRDGFAKSVMAPRAEPAGMIGLLPGDVMAVVIMSGSLGKQLNEQVAAVWMQRPQLVVVRHP
jgi:hypothetical protein